MGKAGSRLGRKGRVAASHIAEDPHLKLDEVVRRRLLAGAGLSARDYLATLRRRDEMKREMEAALAGAHAFLTPTTETAAIPLAEVDQARQPTRLARFANILEMCALALRIGQAYQQATDWHERLPPVIEHRLSLRT